MPVSLKYYNTSGELVETLILGLKPAGYHHTIWQAEGCVSRLCLCQMVAGQHTVWSRMMLMQ